MNQDERIDLFIKLKSDVHMNENLSFDYFNLYSDFIRKNILGKKSSSLYAGVDFMRVKNMIRKKINSTLHNDQENNSLEFVSLSDISKMSLKERIIYKQTQLDLNTKFNIYEDIREYIQKEISEAKEIDNITNIKNYNHKSLLDSNTIEDIFNQIVIKEVNDQIINNILNNSKLYIGLVLVRSERLENLFQKLNEFNINLSA